MTSTFKFILSASRIVFSHKPYILLSIFAAVFMFSLLIFVPVGHVSATVLYYQVTSLDPGSLFSIGLFSVVWGILIAMHVYRLKKTHSPRPKTLGQGIVSMLSSLMAGIFGSAVCVACVSILFGFLGLPVIAFLLAYRQEFFFLSCIIAFLSLYFSSQAIVSHQNCAACRIR